MGGTGGDLWSWGLPVVHQEGVHLLWGAKGVQPGKGGNNDHTPLPAHPSIGNHQFLLPQDGQYGAQDYQLTQSQHKVTYAKVLQYWAKKAHLPIPDQPHNLVGSTVELQWAMELLVSFMEEEVFMATVPSNWIGVRSPRLMESILWDPHS